MSEGSVGVGMERVRKQAGVTVSGAVRVVVVVGRGRMSPVGRV